MPLKMCVKNKMLKNSDWKVVWLEKIRGNVSDRLDFKVMLGDTIPALTEIVVKSLSA